MKTHKEKLDEIINQLDDNQVAEIVDFAEFLKNKTEREFWKNLPVDDEDVTEDDLTSIKEGEEDLKSGRSMSYEEVFGNEE